MASGSRLLWRAARRSALRNARNSSSGFSLIELMITVAIIGILAAIAYPAYRSYVLRANRTDAVRALTLDAQILQRCYTQSYSFSACAGPVDATSPNGYYTITPTAAPWGATPTTFLLTATVTGNQAADTTCNTFTIDQNGAETAQNAAMADETTTCWGGN